MIQLDKVPVLLLDYLREKLQGPDLTYVTPPTRFSQGQETYTYRFELKETPSNIPKHLVLRLFREMNRGFALKEGAIQNILLDNHYPAAKVHFICDEQKQLGGEFIIMDLIQGKPMLEAVPPENLPKMLAETHTALHSIKPDSLVEILKSTTVPEVWYDGTVFVDMFIESKNIGWLKPAVRWIRQNEPTQRRRALCHGDFHPLNILVDDGRVSGVLDWSACRIGEPEWDVAGTSIICSHVARFIIPGIDWLSLVDGYLESYRRRARLDSGKLEYYEAVQCIVNLEVIASGAAEIDFPGVKEGLVKKFNEISGIKLVE